MKRSVLRAGLSSLAIGLFLVGSIGEALAAPLIVHDSLERYFVDSVTLVPEGTEVSTCQGATAGSVGEGCPSLTPHPFGDITGTLLWQVTEKVFKDPAVLSGITQFNYAIANLSSSSTFGSTFTINSFTVEHNGFDTPGTEIIGEFPSGWVFTTDATNWIWTCLSPTSCIFPSSLLFPVFLGGFKVTIIGGGPGGSGLVPVGFDLTTIDTGTLGVPTVPPTVLASASGDWKISAPLALIAEPSTLFLLGLGLLGLGVWSRKQKRLAQPA